MEQGATTSPNPLMILPFGVLLGFIALGPLLFAKWWNKHYPHVALTLGAITLAYYLIGLQDRDYALHTAIEYISFISLIGSLFVVSGGIHITIKGEATPWENIVFLFVGAVIANVLGTTGASMLMIRPWLRMNKYRITAHHIVFFIFIVSNVGGCLTPIGDPPLFLGYLKGVPFLWVAEHCLPIWAVAVGVLLAMFYVVDTINYRRAPKSVRDKLAEPPDHWRFEGLSNLFFLAIIVGAVFVEKPRFLREALMVGAAVGSYFTTRKSIHHSNDFNFRPVQEVAILFAGIFATMMPALQWLELNAGKFGGASASFYYWGAGSLSGILDNAPTYLSFLSASFGALLDGETIRQVQELVQNGGAGMSSLTGPHAEQIRETFAMLQKYHAPEIAAKSVSTSQIEIAFLIGNIAYNKYLLAISVGSVFFGANTYIGNGPNFMVKAIADQQKIHTPGFIGYVLHFTLPFMLPMLLIVWFIFFR